MKKSCLELGGKWKSKDNPCTSISLMQYLDEHRPDDKMCLSNGECAQIDKAWKQNDWETIIKYIKKYTDNGNNN